MAYSARAITAVSAWLARIHDRNDVVPLPCLIAGITIARFAPFSEETAGSTVVVAFGFGVAIFVLV